MKVGYVRVSTEEQNLDRQTEFMKTQGIEKVFSEKLSAKSAERPELKKMLDYVREGDTLVVESVSRLARSTKDLLSIVDSLKIKGVTLVSQKESIDTNTASGKFVLTIFAALAELERENILLRQSEGIAVAKAKGKHLGRPPFIRPQGWDEVINSWKSGEVSAVEAMRKLKMAKSTFYKLVKAS